MLVKETRSAFSRRYTSEIMKWVIGFEYSPDTIISISRKGPRLFELLSTDDLISKSVLQRTCTEYAIPFLKNIDCLTVIDDSVLYGSTIKETVDIIKTKLHVEEKDLSIIPFRYSINTPKRIKDLIVKEYSSSISLDESSVHINQLIHSFKELGKPYDLEFPIIYLDGDFSDTTVLIQKLEGVCKGIGDSSLIINSTTNYPDCYTLLIKGQNARGNNGGPEFSKIRVNVRMDYQQISFTPISPCIISNEDLIAFDKTLELEYQFLWTEILSNVKSKRLDSHDYRSLIVWANYLKSLSFFTKRIKFFEKFFETSNLYLKQFDVQLLLGFELAEFVAPTLASLLKNKKKFVFFEQNFRHYSNIKEYKLPEEIEQEFFDCCEQEYGVVKSLNSESEILNHFFNCQHTKLELSTRRDENFNSVERLKFGFTLNFIIGLVFKNKQDASIVNIHAAFDRLIDIGAIVPKYMNLSSEEGKIIWGRVYRIGEGKLPTPRKILMILRLFENLKKVFGKDRIPAIVLEKYSVLALTPSFNFKELSEDGITDLEIKKKFSLYGARSYVTTDANGSGMYLLDWAKSLRVIDQNDKEEYFVNPSVAKNYDANDLAVTNTAKDKLEDIGEFCHLLSSKMSETPLVLLTTLSSPKEFWYAISAELNLWLNHLQFGIYNCIHRLGEVRYSEKKDIKQRIHDCNKTLMQNANFTAQVGIKAKMFQGQNDIFNSIENVVEQSNKSTVQRVWRDIKDYMASQKADSTGDYNSEELIITLRVCHNLSSLCRTLLDKTEFKVSDGSRTLKHYLKVIFDIIESTKTSSHILWHQFETNGIHAMLKDIIVRIEDPKTFNECFDQLKPFLLKISSTIHEIFNLQGAIETKLHPVKELPPPVYIVMWDVRESTQVEDRTNIERNVFIPIKEQIKSLLSSKKLEDLVINIDDGGSFLTSNFSDVIMAFSIINKVGNEQKVKFRVGCDVNFEGDLHVYTEKNIIGGRAYEYASRTTNFFKEITTEPERWDGDFVKEPDKTYLILGEFVKRIAAANEDWTTGGFEEIPLKGTYKPRVRKGIYIPYSLSLLMRSD